MDLSDIMLMVGTLILAGAGYLWLGLAAALGVVGGVLVIAGILKGLTDASATRTVLGRRVQ